MCIFEGCPYLRGGRISWVFHISGVCVFQGGEYMYMYFRVVRISGLCVFPGCAYSRGVRISGVSVFQGYAYFKGVCKTEFHCITKDC